MLRESVVIALDSSVTPARSSGSSVLSDYWALTKPEVNFLILITTFAGFYLGSANDARPFSFLALFNTLLGTLLVASGTATLNQYIERNFDSLMRRTARRPLAAGRLKPGAVLAFGIGLSAVGGIYLAVCVGLLASVLALVTLCSYLFLYTPLKRKTALCVLVGAFPGAMPPLIGWAATSDRLSIEAWILYAVVFLWQFPHFMAIAWMYREDYLRAGYVVLPHGDRRDALMGFQTLLPSFGLAVLSLAPALLGKDGLFYAMGVLFFSTCFLYYGGQLAVRRTNAAARRLLLASIVYLPIVFVLMVVGRT
jgi:heme o synthase